MLGNANVGGTPLVVYAGCPARADAYAEPVLGGDPVAVAAPVSKWAWELRTADEIPAVVARAFKVALTPPRGPVVLVAGTDVMAAPCAAEVAAPSPVRAPRPDPDAIREAAALLAGAERPALVAGDGAVGAGGAVVRVAELLDAAVYSTGTEAVV